MDLTEEVRNIIIEKEDPNLSTIDLAIAVFESIDPKDYSDALQQTLPPFVSIVLAKFNNAYKPDNQNRTSITKPKRKSRLQRGREQEIKEVGRWYRRKVFTGSEWIYFKDATPKDIMHAAERRRKQAAGLMASAARLEAIANLMANNGFDTAGQISEDDLDSLLQINDLGENS